MYQSLDRCGQMALSTNLQKQLLGLCSNHSTAACEMSGLDCSAVALKLFEAIRKTSDVSGIEDSIALMNTLAIHNKHERYSSVTAVYVCTVVSQKSAYPQKSTHLVLLAQFSCIGSMFTQMSAHKLWVAKSEAFS